MSVFTTAVINLIVVLVIGVVVGLVFNRNGRSWLGVRAVAVTGSSADATYALVGIAGAFIGFHLAVIVGLLPTPLMLYLATVAGAVVSLWLWSGR
jgi:hypothetical protein